MCVGVWWRVGRDCDGFPHFSGAGVGENRGKARCREWEWSLEWGGNRGKARCRFEWGGELTRSRALGSADTELGAGVRAGNREKRCRAGRLAHRLDGGFALDAVRGNRRRVRRAGRGGCLCGPGAHRRCGSPRAMSGGGGCSGVRAVRRCGRVSTVCGGRTGW